MKSNSKIIVAAAVALLLAVALVLFRKSSPISDAVEERSDAQAGGAPTLELLDSQLAAIRIGRIGLYSFPTEMQAVGSIDFDEDLSVQVFPPYQGKIIEAFAKLGDEVQKGVPLYTIESPDLLQAESTLVGAAAALELTGKELVRARELYDTGKGVAQRELEQATSDQQTAEGALNAARSAVRVFGKTDDEINRMIDSRKSDPVLVVRSPETGQVTARNAQPGLLVQPGNSPAPFSVADVSTKWMLAYVTESDSPLVQVGQRVRVFVLAFPGREFSGRVTAIGATVDPNTHRVLVRSEVADTKHELRPGMVATFSILVHADGESPAIPEGGVVREGDGTTTAWVATDRNHFAQRAVRVGLERDGRWQVLDGLKQGETVVTEGAVFLSNMLTAPDAD
jgi:cobalt-zinc-cadmium efflux system membrane fusion protein